jgi:hypothetical protein
MDRFGSMAIMYSNPPAEKSGAYYRAFYTIAIGTHNSITIKPVAVFLWYES